MRRTVKPSGTPRRGLRFRTVRALGLAAVLAVGTRAAAEEPAPQSAPAQGVFKVVGAELSRWGSDSLALVTAPASWEGSDRARFGVASAGIGGLMLADGSFYDYVEGHRTEAFTVASVVATHSVGWVVPTIAYTVASLVGVSRVVTGHHFASDVVAGAVLGTTVGRFVVSRHRPPHEGRPQAVRVTLVAIPHGLSVHASS